MNQEIEIKQVRRNIKDCDKCPMVDHSLMFPGDYVDSMKYFFVGAAPWTVGGPEEAFRTGTATANFEKFLKAAGIDRDECYTTNAVMHVPQEISGKSRQPNNTEIRNCSHWLNAQIQIMQPKVIVALGAIAIEALRIIRWHQISVMRSVGRAVPWFDDKWIFVLTHPSPMAVSFRGESQQIQDYISLKTFTENLERDFVPQRILAGEAWMNCKDCGARLFSFDGKEDQSVICPYMKNGRCEPK